MSKSIKPIKPAGWLVLDPEGGYEYGCMDPDYGRDFCHDHIKDAQESGMPRARKWVVRESFSRDQVEQATAELRAELARVTESARTTIKQMRDEGMRAEAERDEARAELSACADERNNYSRILTVLGMEEEGDPVAEVDALMQERDQLHEARAELARLTTLRPHNEHKQGDRVLIWEKVLLHEDRWLFWNHGNRCPPGAYWTPIPPVKELK
jgi:hypothetical protein